MSKVGTNLGTYNSKSLSKASTSEITHSISCVRHVFVYSIKVPNRKVYSLLVIEVVSGINVYESTFYIILFKHIEAHYCYTLFALTITV
jgi:hypothetical protein